MEQRMALVKVPRAAAWRNYLRALVAPVIGNSESNAARLASPIARSSGRRERAKRRAIQVEASKLTGTAGTVKANRPQTRAVAGFLADRRRGCGREQEREQSGNNGNRESEIETLTHTFSLRLPIALHCTPAALGPCAVCGR